MRLGPAPPASCTAKGGPHSRVLMAGGSGGSSYDEGWTGQQRRIDVPQVSLTKLKSKSPKWPAVLGKVPPSLH